MSVDPERTLSTARLALEPILPRHADLLFGVLQDPSIYTFMPTEPPDSAAALRTRYEVLAARRSPDGAEIWLNWAVCVEATGEYAGTVQATIRADETALLAYELGAAHRGAGYATEACRAVMRELVDGYRVGEILAYVDTRNERSIRLLERLGFERTARIPEADFFKGAPSNEYVYTWTRT